MKKILLAGLLILPLFLLLIIPETYATQAAPSPTCKITSTVLNVSQNTNDNYLITVKINDISTLTNEEYSLNCVGLYPLGSNQILTLAEQNIISGKIPSSGDNLEGNIHFGGDEFANGIYLTNYNIISPTIPCKNLYWIDNTHKDCTQQKFCGAYIYYGLQTFEDKDDCAKAINLTETRKLDDDNETEDNDNENDYENETETRSCAAQNQMCGGIAGLICCADLTCNYGANAGLPDASGTCINKRTSSNSCDTDNDCIVSACFSNKCVNKEYTQKVTACSGPSNNPLPDSCSCKNNICISNKQLSNGRKAEIKFMPETASERARERLGELGFNITLKEIRNKNETRMAYHLESQKEFRILGFIKKNATVEADVDVETGEVIKTHKPWWAFLASEK